MFYLPLIWTPTTAVSSRSKLRLNSEPSQKSNSTCTTTITIMPFDDTEPQTAHHRRRSGRLHHSFFLLNLLRQWAKAARRYATILWAPKGIAGGGKSTVHKHVHKTGNKPHCCFYLWKLLLFKGSFISRERLEPRILLYCTPNRETNRVLQAVGF